VFGELPVQPWGYGPNRLVVENANSGRAGHSCLEYLVPHWLLVVLNLGFFALHTCIIGINVLGWAFSRIRRANLLLLLGTLFSWCAMGVFYGVGYCVCTDWHFQVRQALGLETPTDNYVGFLVWRITGWIAPESLVRQVCAAVFVTCLLLSIVLNVRDARRRRLDRTPIVPTVS
jgi:hypothetical protein